MKKTLQLNKLFFLVAFGICCVSCKKSNGLGSSDIKEKPEKVYSLNEEQRSLIKGFTDRYSSSVYELLQGAGIGFVSPTETEEFQAEITPEGLYVIGDSSAHEKIALFLRDYLTREYIDSLFEATEASNAEWLGKKKNYSERGQRAI
ncbi:hypothetical protein JO972_15980 [Verrucomicrobiaceae bacterium 5K15]|uniref:Uncharacterized protein n=1 Tax=Oceaniferula flava TaxID=2800421 RepID=A0AAE2VAA5_9BACT|nr:hypothetical protein [Oceaniferula flavus]MBK1856468.1 hypothetical protein [Oceaniferula flavus]MBM1137775.1 hypothetical protein [Oceaniferula flavus]